MAVVSVSQHKGCVHLSVASGGYLHTLLIRNICGIVHHIIVLTLSRVTNDSYCTAMHMVCDGISDRLVGEDKAGFEEPNTQGIVF